ncbi:thiol peroxidase [Salisediminibacterium beveridgei]|uniref:Thiol peroxidase n=1 Tax=Salisediminibacterium beveridgei TaxID=632773 RepID=A0A1D7QTE1_9BACI|nr:thiol peroxidase [Salisediminibacterium beveridgei]AOM82238.1 Thiol peroxidase, Tpx-type [Salisediminibacterium beveridgei]
MTVTFKENPVTLKGTEVQKGEQAPDFTVLANDLSDVKLSDFNGKTRLISVVPSIDTGVCDEQTRRFNEEASKLDDVEIITISVDLPFAQRRWCAAAGVDNIQVTSDHRDLDFGMKYGVVIDELRLLARSIFIVDKNGTLQYKEVVPEVTNHPDYDQAIAAAKEMS